MKDSTERAAWISAAAVIVAALIGAMVNTTSRPAVETPAQPGSQPRQTRNEPAAPMPQQPQNAAISGRQGYDVSAWVPKGKTYIDPKTAFVYAVDDIDDPGGFLHVDGAFSWYTTPDGKRHETLGYPLGFRDDFEYRGRRFAFVIEEIDYRGKRVKIRIREL